LNGSKECGLKKKVIATFRSKTWLIPMRTSASLVLAKPNATTKRELGRPGLQTGIAVCHGNITGMQQQGIFPILPVMGRRTRLLSLAEGISG
jgi:hypothetical protein